MKLLFILFWLIPTVTYGAELKHMVMFGRDGLGWTGAAEDIKTESDSRFKSVDYYLSNFAVNYAYLIVPRVQLGFFFENYNSEYDFKLKGGGSAPIKVESTSIGCFVLYNFSDDLNDSWYSGLAVAQINYEEENSHLFSDAEGKAPFELDNHSQLYEFILGKRFSLRGFNVANLTYSPQINIYYRTNGKDFNDQDIGGGTGLSLRPIKFDLLF